MTGNRSHVFILTAEKSITEFAALRFFVLLLHEIAVKLCQIGFYGY